MADTDEFTDEPVETEPEQGRRSLGTLGTVLAIIAVAIIVLLLWRSCGSAQGEADTESGGNVITTIEDLEYAAAGVAVWVRPGTDIRTVLERNGLGDAVYSDLGEGTYVVEVGAGGAQRAVERLKDDAGLYDAGFIYTDPSGK